MNRYVPIGILRFTLGLFFVILGITNTAVSLDSSIFAFARSFRDAEWVFGIIEIVLGMLLLAGFVTSVRRNTRTWANLVVLIFWIARMVFARFIQSLSVSNNAIVFHPSFSAWFLILAVELVIAAAVFAVYQSE